MSCEGLENVTIGKDVDRYFQVGIQLPVEDKKQLVDFLKDNLDVFAWSAPRVDPEFICHLLNVNPKATRKKELPWRSSKKHAEAFTDEARKLKQARAIKGVFYPEWLANIVVPRRSCPTTSKPTP